MISTGAARRIDGMGDMSLREASARFGIPVMTLHGWAAAGLLPVDRGAERPGGPVIVLGADVARLAEHYVPGAGRGKRRRLAEAAGVEERLAAAAR